MSVFFFFCLLRVLRSQKDPPFKPPSKEISIVTGCEVKIWWKVHLTVSRMALWSCRFPLAPEEQNTELKKDTTDQNLQHSTYLLINGNSIAPFLTLQKNELSYSFSEGGKSSFTSVLYTAMIEKYLTWKRNINSF